MTMSGIVLVEKKDHKIELRVSSSELELIERAAKLSESKRSQYVRRNILRSATQTVSEAQRLPLNWEDYQHLQAALDEPVRSLPRLKRLFEGRSVFGE